MKIGIIGCGRISGTHLRAYNTIPNAEVVGVADTDLNRAKAFATENHIANAYADYHELFKIPDLKLVDICTPTFTHESITCDAAQSGINVLMEKPMSRHSDQCERMIEQARKYGTKLCVCHNQLFYPHVKQLEDIANKNNFKMTSFRTAVKENFDFLKVHNLAHDWNVDPKNGGILWEVGCHLAYLQLHFLKDINEVYALAVKAQQQVWDDFVVLLRTKSGTYGFIEVSWIIHEPEMVYEVVGANGGRAQTFLPHGYIIERDQDSLGNAKDVILSYLSDESRLTKKWVKWGKDQIKKPQLGHLDLIRTYVESLENNKAPPVTGEDGRNAIRLLECIEQSITEKRAVEFSSW
jgi:UDP-N-acetyl-2-amino-2-deoxyglucuronate dehydrogenase